MCCSWLSPDPLSVCVGDSSWRSEQIRFSDIIIIKIWHSDEIVEKSEIVPFNDIIIIIIIVIIIVLVITDIFACQWSKQPHGLYKPVAGSFHSPAVIPPSALDKPSIMKRCHHQQTCSHTSSRLLPTMVTLHDTRFVECRWWNDGWTMKTVVTWRSSASMIPAPGGRFACPWLISRGSSQSRLSQDNDLFKFCSR